MNISVNECKKNNGMGKESFLPSEIVFLHNLSVNTWPFGDF